MIIDEIDKRILESLLENARVKMVDIAKECQVSITTVIKRIERMKKEGVIVDETLIIYPRFFGYQHPVSIGINLEIDQEENIHRLIGEKTKMFGIDRLIGTYDLHVFAYAKTLEDIQEIKQAIQKHKGVNNVEILVWSKAFFRFDNFQLDQKVKNNG